MLSTPINQTILMKTEEEKMGNDYNVEFLMSNEDERVFYVRPFSKEVKDDLDRLMSDCGKVSKAVTITEKNGTYAISTVEMITPSTFMSSFWGMLCRKFISESKHVCIDPINKEKYYAVIMSNQFIEPCGRKLAA